MKIILAVIFAIACSISVYGQDTTSTNSLGGTVMVENTITDGKISPQIKANVTYGGKGKIGGYCWIQSSRSYSQVYCGPTIQPKGWIQVGVAMGFETGKKPFKGAGFIWVGKGKFSNLLVLEKGSGELWYRNQAGYKLNKILTLSVASQRYQGTGPRMDFAIPKTRLTVGGEYLSTRTAKFGVAYSF